MLDAGSHYWPATSTIVIVTSLARGCMRARPAYDLRSSGGQASAALAVSPGPSPQRPACVDRGGDAITQRTSGVHDGDGIGIRDQRNGGEARLADCATERQQGRPYGRVGAEYRGFLGQRAQIERICGQ